MAELVDHVGQPGYGHHHGAGHLRRLPSAVGGDGDSADSGPDSGSHHRQDASDGAYPTVQGQFAEEYPPGDPFGWDDTGGGQQRHGQREIGRRVVDRWDHRCHAHRDPGVRPGCSAVEDRGPDSCAGRPDRRFGQADQMQLRVAGYGLGLDVDHMRSEAGQGDRSGGGVAHAVHQPTGSTGRARSGHCAALSAISSAMPAKSMPQTVSGGSPQSRAVRISPARL